MACTTNYPSPFTCVPATIAGMNILEQFPFLSSLPPETAAFVVQLLLVAITFSVLYILRRAIRAVIFSPLKRMLDRKESKLGRITYEALERSSRLLVFAAAIYITLGLFEFGAGLEGFAAVIARALLIIAAFVALYSVVDVVFTNVSTVENVLGVTIEERLVPFLRVVIQVTIVIIGLLIILQEFGVNVTALLASFGVVGLALSLAAQDTASNIFSFAAIVSDNPFKVGDFITTPDFTGTIESVGVRTTRVRKLDQTLVIVPNNLLTSVAVVNASRLTKRRLDFFVRLEYDTTPSQMRAVVGLIREMLQNRPYTEPGSVVVNFVNFSENSLDVRVIAYIMLADWNAFTAEQEEVNLAILEIVNSLGIKMGRQSLFLDYMPSYDELPQPVKDRIEDISRATQRIRAVEVVPPSDVPDQVSPSASNDDALKP